MRRYRALVIVAAIVITASPARPEPTLPSPLQVLGSVTNASRPIANALIVALNLTDFAAVQTYTSIDGSFALPPLPSGVYKLIAIKAGFLPATTMVVPTKTDHRVNLRLKTENQARARSANDEIWELRGSLPPDILREVDNVLRATAPLVAYQVPRLRGEMMSMAGVANQRREPAYAQTALGVQSRIGETWQLGIRGDLRRFKGNPNSEEFDRAIAESSAMEMELRSSPTDSYKVATTKSSWRYRDLKDEAAVQSHNFEWEHGGNSVKVRYFAQDNLSRSRAFDSDVLEIAGNTVVLQTDRNDIGVSLRVRQENVRTADMTPMRTADLSANGTFAAVPSLILHYGMGSRVGIDRSEVAPSTGFEWKLTKDTSLVGSAAYKVLSDVPGAMMYPSLVVWSDDLQVLPRYSYSLGFVSSRNDSNRISAIVTLSAADSPLQVIFADGYQQFWDGLYVDSGDVRRDVRLAYRRDVGKRFAIDVATTAGTVSPRAATAAEKVYVSGDLQTIFTPTGTAMVVSYREIQQPQANAGHYRSARMNVRMAQSLYLPIDVRLLLGVELARAENSPFLVDAMLPEETAKKYIGGLAVNF
jgi:hypothetical protein